jgi:hypothetical protein
MILGYGIEEAIEGARKSDTSMSRRKKIELWMKMIK